MSGRTTVCKPGGWRGQRGHVPGPWPLIHLAMAPGMGEWAVDEQLAELGRVLSKRIGALAAAMAGVWGGLVAAGRERLRRRLAVGRTEARDLGAARDDGVAVMSPVRWRSALGRDVR